MNKLIIYTLEGCNKCALLKTKLKENNVNYTEISCEQCSECCDSVEDAFNITTYPIVKLEIGGSAYYGFVKEESNRIIKMEYIPNIYLDSFLSIDKLFDYIISKLG